MATFLFPKKESFGGAVGTALGTGLQALAEQKLKQVNQRNQENKLASAYKNLFPEQQPGITQALAALEPKEREIALKNLFAGQSGQGLEQAYGLENQTGEKKSIPKGLNPKQIADVAKFNRQQEHFETRLKATEQKEADKETLPFYNEITKEAKAAKNNDKRLDRMEVLIKRGDISGPIPTALINTLAKGIFGIGIDLSGLQSADTQEFNKLSKDFLKEAKGIFGARLTDTDVKLYLETVPSLLQSDEGRKRVVFNLKSFNEAAKIRKKVADEIIEKNGGRRPRNLDSLVDKIAEPELDKIAEEFKIGLAPEKNIRQQNRESLESAIESISPSLANLVRKIP